jgi:hypothetical protein
MITWRSIGVYEHPAKHQRGTYGHVVRHNTGIYSLSVGGSLMSCSQSWADEIEKNESEKTTINIRCTEAEKNHIEAVAKKLNFTSVSELVRKTFLDISL